MMMVMPIERQRLTAICRRMFQPFSAVRNPLDRSEIATIIATSAIKGCRRDSVLLFKVIMRVSVRRNVFWAKRRS